MCTIYSNPKQSCVHIESSYLQMPLAPQAHMSPLGLGKTSQGRPPSFVPAEMLYWSLRSMRHLELCNQTVGKFCIPRDQIDSTQVKDSHLTANPSPITLALPCESQPQLRTTTVSHERQHHNLQLLNTGGEHLKPRKDGLGLRLGSHTPPRCWRSDLRERRWRSSRFAGAHQLQERRQSVTRDGLRKRQQRPQNRLRPTRHQRKRRTL